MAVTSDDARGARSEDEQAIAPIFTLEGGRLPADALPARRSSPTSPTR
jgi:hypothetical protein